MISLEYRIFVVTGVKMFRFMEREVCVAHFSDEFKAVQSDLHDENMYIKKMSTVQWHNKGN